MTTKNKRPRALVVLSGGQDSTTCLAWAGRRFDEVHAISFSYGQRHKTELEAAARVAERAGVASHVVIPLPLGYEVLGASSAITNHDVPVESSGGLYDAAAPHDGLPTTFVPGRNMIFLAVAAARAVAVGARDIVVGVCETDYSGYPDCRQSFVDAMQVAVNAALPSSCGPVRIHAPLMELSKAESVQLAADLGALGLLALTVTCYEGQRPGCGTCPACRLRAEGFAEAGFRDPAEQVAAGSRVRDESAKADALVLPGLLGPEGGDQAPASILVDPWEIVSVAAARVGDRNGSLLMMQDGSFSLSGIEPGAVMMRIWHKAPKEAARLGYRS